MKSRITIREIAALMLLTVAAVAVHGYHFGVEDAASYVPAIRHAIDPSLYPHDANFAAALSHFGLFVPMVAESVRATHVSVEWAAFCWHLLSIFVLLAACLKFARICFSERAAQLGAVVAVWGALLLPVAGTGIAITERYLHPRNLAIGAVVFAIAAALEHRPAAFAWLAAAVAIHPTIGICGAFHAAVQWWRPPRKSSVGSSGAIAMAGAPVVIASILPQAIPAWRALIESHRYLFLLRWHWYEWLGVVAPLILLEVFASIARHDGNEMGAHVARGAAIAGFLGTLGALVITSVPRLLPLVAVEPMRVLQVVYLFFVVIGGGLTGKHVLGIHRARWAVFVLFFVAAFYFADKVEYPASEHIEWPGMATQNAWREAFEWARENTPRDAYFAIDPLYTQRSGEDVHGFRAFTQRSVLADFVKDQSVVQVNSDLTVEWKRQTDATENWQKFGVADFTKLAENFGVNWVVLERRSAAVVNLDCPYENLSIAVCKVR